MSTVFRARASSTQVKYRKWDKVIQPLLKYKRSSSNLGYPMSFTHQIQKIINKGMQLKLNIPITLSGAHDNVFKTTFNDQNEQIGTIAFKPSVLKSNFDTQVEKQINKEIEILSSKDSHFKEFIQEKVQSNTYDQSLPFIVIKQKCTGIVESEQAIVKSYLLNKDEYKKINTTDPSHIIQSYVYPNSNNVSITRFFYHPKKETLSIAYKMDSLEPFIKKKFYKSLWKIKQSNQNTFTFTKIMHQNKSFTKQTQNLVKALETINKVFVEKIVCDWVIDCNNRYYLIEVRQVVMEAKPIKQISATINKDLNEVLSLITCSVCQQKFQNAQMTKLITYKLIWQFFQHLKKRKVDLSFKPNYKYSSNTARVCDLCYMLVVSESKLIELEKTAAMATNSIEKSSDQFQINKIVLNDDPTVSGTKVSMDKYKEKHLRQLYSWRLFFYIEDLKQLQLEDFSGDMTYYLMINLHNQITSFKLKKIETEQHSIKGIKISYLFSQKDKVDKFLNKSQITIRITNQNNWNAVIAEGSSNSLYEQSEKFSMRKFKQILLFNSKSKYSVLGLHIGIKLDGQFNTQRLTLNKVHDAYLANEKYINCLSIPPQWMEIIDPVYCVNKDRHQKFQYQMNMNQKQIKSLLPSITNIPGKKRLVL